MLIEVQVRAGDFLFKEGEESFEFYIIKAGQLEISKSLPTGNSVVLANVGPGRSIGEFAMLDQQPRSASARALTDVIALKVEAAAYDNLLQELPDWAYSVMQSLVERIRSTNEIVRRYEEQLQRLKSSEKFEPGVLKEALVTTEYVNSADEDTITTSKIDFSLNHGIKK